MHGLADARRTLRTAVLVYYFILRDVFSYTTFISTRLDAFLSFLPLSPSLFSLPAPFSFLSPLTIPNYLGLDLVLKCVRAFFDTPLIEAGF